jgi:hypothetical protein
MRNLLTASVGIAVLLAGGMAFQSTADPRRDGGAYRSGDGQVRAVDRSISAGRVVNPNLNRNISRNTNVSRNADTNRSANINRKVDVNRNIYRDATVTRNKDISRNVSRNVNVNGNVAGTTDRNIKYVYRNGQRGYWRNGAWIAAPAVGAAIYGYVPSSCAYQYGKWQVTGSTYWRDLYNACSKAFGAPPEE